MHIRDAVRSDLPELVALLAQDDLGAKRDDAHEPVSEAYVTAFEAIDRDPNNRIIVGQDGGRIVAMLQLTVLPHLTFRGGLRAQIEGVRVAAERRGQGVGRDLLKSAISEAQELGCHLVQLTTNKARGRALRFYESLGFEPTHEGMKRYLHGDVLGR